MQLHVLGLGPVGSLLAHHLRRTTHNPVNLLLSSQKQMVNLHQNGQSIQVAIKGRTFVSTGFTSELSDTPGRPIHSLFVTTKAQATASAIRNLLPRLGPQSTVVLMQNGMGVHEKLMELFPNTFSRPHFILTSNTNGVWSKAPFDIVHAGSGTIQFGVVGTETLPDLESLPEGSLRETIRCLSSLEGLRPQWIPMVEMDHTMRLKLALNAVINPLTAIAGCLNGQVFTDASAWTIAKEVCAEISRVYAADMAPSALPETLSSQSLQERCLHLVKVTASNYSSMNMDIRQGRPTEIDHINGYLVELGRKHGVDMHSTERLLRLVKEKESETSG